jgi:hypothetical protein
MSAIDKKSPSISGTNLGTGHFIEVNRAKENAMKIRLTLILLVCSGISAQAQLYAGVLGGVSSLSGDARSTISSGSSTFSSYDPDNGGAVELLAGKHLSEYFSVQGNYIWNANNLTVSAGSFQNGLQTTHVETRGSSQQSLIAAVLVYFRDRDSRLRPYLSVGTGVVHLSSSQKHVDQSFGAPTLPPRKFNSNMIALHVPVGIDVKLGRGWAVRYTFSETISKNPIDNRLSPPGQHAFKNFLNLFGLVKQF